MTAVQGTVKGHQDFRRLWTGSAVSQLGSAVGMVAFPVIAVTVLQASTFEVAVLSAASAATSAVLALPIGRHAEFRRKRPLMVVSDLVRCVSLLSVPLAAVLGRLTMVQLCVVAAVNAAGLVLFNTASQAHLTALVTPERLIDANSRLESTRWLTITVGPAVAGPLLGVLGAVWTVVVDAVSFLFSAAMIRRIRQPEPAPPARAEGESRFAELFGGWRFVRRHPLLRRLLISWVLFAGSTAMGAAISSVYYLRDLGFSAFAYALLMGVPSLGGFLGARLTRRLIARAGVIRALWLASVFRGPSYLLIPLAGPGTPGLVMCGIGFGLLLFFSGLANSAMTGYRQLETPENLMSRVASLWALATTVTQPLFILLGGLIGALTGNRVALFLVAGLIVAASLLLPFRRTGGESGT